MPNEVIRRMLERYEGRVAGDAVRALREILQETALLGLWRGKFFEHAAFYGGTALRLCYGLDRFSEDLDFSLLKPARDFDLARVSDSLQREIRAFGFDVSVAKKLKTQQGAIQSAFIKVNTRRQLLRIQAEGEGLSGIPPDQVLSIKLEVDTDPPGGFETESRFLLQPIPFPVRVFVLPDLFAGKMHAVLCRRWKNRVKGRDWYDWVWYASHHPRMHLAHLEQRMIQSGHWSPRRRLSEMSFRRLAQEAIDRLDVAQARREVEPFVQHPEALQVWSRPFFKEILRKTEVMGLNREEAPPAPGEKTRSRWREQKFGA